jgi:hypothetical protein
MQCKGSKRARDQDLYAWLRSATVVVADNVCEFYYAVNPKEQWSERDDFPDQRPPFEPHIWIDCRAPKEIVSEKYGRLPWLATNPGRWGVALTYQDDLKGSVLGNVLHEMARDASFADLARRAPTLARLLGRVIEHGPGDDPDALLRAVHQLPASDLRALTETVIGRRGWDKEAILARAHGDLARFDGEEEIRAGRLPRYSVHATLYWDWSTTQMGGAAQVELHRLMGRRPIRREWHWVYGVLGHDGSIYAPNWPNSWGQTWPDPDGILGDLLGDLGQTPAALEAMSDQSRHLAPFLQVALLTVTFLNTKNVRTADVEIPAALQKARAKRGAPPLVDYKVVALPFGGSEKTVQRRISEGSKEHHDVMLHVVRGHVKHYPAPGLFGRIVGNFFWSQHIRGTPEAGVLVKDYEMVPDPRSSPDPGVPQIAASADGASHHERPRTSAPAAHTQKTESPPPRHPPATPHRAEDTRNHRHGRPSEHQHTTSHGGTKHGRAPPGTAAPKNSPLTYLH